MIDERLIRNAIYAASQIVCAHAEAMGMAAENYARDLKGESIPFMHEDFTKLIDRYGLGHNDILTTLNN